MEASLGLDGAAVIVERSGGKHENSAIHRAVVSGVSECDGSRVEDERGVI